MPVREEPSIYVFNRDEVLQTILSNADKRACPILEAKITEELNGPITFEFEVPADHAEAVYIQEDYLVVVKDKENLWQGFFIRELEDIHGDEWRKRAFCEHGIVDLQDYIIQDLFIDRKDAPTTLPQLLSGTRWQLGTSQTHADVHDITVKYKSVMEALTTFLKRWKVECRYRLNIAQQAITARYIDIYTTRGTDTGKRFEYNKDMTNITRTIDTSQIKTAMIGIGATDEAGNPITFADINGGYNFVTDEAARLKWGRPVGGVRKSRFGIYENTQQTDKAALKRETEAALAIAKDPIVQYEMKVLDITAAANVPHEAVTLGMTVTAIDRDLGISLKARCIKLVTDLLNIDFSDVTLGNFLPTMTEKQETRVVQLEEVSRQTVTKGSPIATEWLEGTINALNNLITAGTGTVTITEGNGILVENAEKTKAIRLLGGVLAIANSKDATTGLYNWRTFGTGDGFVADQITSGFMLFDRARGGTLLLGGANNANGRMLVYNAAGDVIADLDAAKGGFNALYVADLKADNVINKNDKTYDLVARPSDGSDNDDGLTTATAKKRLQAAINAIPKHNNGYITIWCENNQYYESEILIEGFFGKGQITIDLGGGTVNGMIRVRNNNQSIIIQNGLVNQVYGTEFLNEGSITAYYTPFLKLYAVQVYSRANVDFGLKCRGGTTIVEACKFYDQTTSCIQAEYGGTVDMIGNNEGEGRAGLRAIGTGRIAMYGGTMPRGTVLNVETASGGEVVGTTSGHVKGTPSTLALPPTTKQYQATTIRSWRTIYGWRTDNYYIYQGQWGGFGNHKGCFWWNRTQIATDISGKTLRMARIYMKRRGEGGYSGKTALQLWTCKSAPTIVGGAEPWADTYLGTMNSYAWNEGLWFDIPFTYISQLAAGTIEGFLIYNSTGANYLIMETVATLELTWA